MRCPSATRSRAPAATRGSGTGTRASRRSSGGGSTGDGRERSWRACSPPSARTASWATRSSGTARSRLTRLPFYNVLSRDAFQTETIQPPLLAWAWSIAVGDPAGEPRIGAHIDWLAANRDLEGDGLLWIVQPDESGPRRLAEVRPDLGPAGELPDRLSAAGAAQPQARIRRSAGSGERRARALRGRRQHALVALPAGDETPLGDPGAGRSALGRAPRRSSSTRPSRAASGRRSSPARRWRRWRCPTCPRRSAGAWSRSTC